MLIHVVPIHTQQKKHLKQKNISNHTVSSVRVLLQPLLSKNGMFLAPFVEEVEHVSETSGPRFEAN